MKKSVLFVLNQMGAGGIAKSLSNLLYHFEKYKDDYDVDLFLLRKDGMYLSMVPSFVHIIEAKGILKLFGASQSDTKKFGFFPYLSRAIIAIYSKVFSNSLPLRIGAFQNKLKQEYDLAVSFAHTQSCFSMAAGSCEFVLKGVTAKRKVCVMHGDFIIENLLTKGNVKRFAQFNKLFCVSKSSSLQLAKSCPKLKDIADYLYNSQLNQEIIDKSTEKDVQFGNNFNLLMASRLTHQKAFFRFLPIVLQLHNEGYGFVLHIVGGGVQEEEIKKYIRDNEMQDYVKMYGNTTNPFPYIKAADLFVLVSYYEAAPMVYGESQLLGTPVFTSRIISADELVGDWGFVCDNNEKAIYDELKYVLGHKELVQQKRENLINYSYDNDAIVRKILGEIH